MTHLPIAEHKTSVFVQNTIRDHQGIRHPFTVGLQCRNNLCESSQPIKAVRTPGLAERSAGHSAFDSDIAGKKIGTSTIGSRPVLGSSLAENGEIARDRKIAGHSDFLAAAHSHSVHPADD